MISHISSFVSLFSLRVRERYYPKTGAFSFHNQITQGRFWTAFTEARGSYQFKSFVISSAEDKLQKTLRLLTVERMLSK